MRLASFLSLVLIAGFLFVGILRLHPVGEPLGNPRVFEDRSSQITDIKNVDTMDDYYLRNGQTETGSNNLVASVVFDYRSFDTLGEATVLFIVVSSISMLLFTLVKRRGTETSGVSRMREFPDGVSRVITFSSFLLYILIVTFGIYLVVHGHISPGGGFQGGAVMASATALLLISSLITRNVQKTKKVFSFFESFGLTLFIGIGFAGIGVSFLFNFLANVDPTFFGRTIGFGPNPGYLVSGGTLPLLSLAIGMEVFFGLSIILVTMYHAAKDEKAGE